MGVLAQPWKHPKTGVYYCRISVPQDVRAVYGKTEIKKSLGTKSAAEARRLFPQVYDTYRFEFEELRRKAELADKPKAQVEATPDVLNRRDIGILVSRFYNNELLKIQHSKENALSLIAKYDLMSVRLGQWAIGKSEITNESATDGLPSDYEQECFELFADEADDLINKAGYFIPRNQPSFKALVTAMASIVPKLRDVVKNTVFWTGIDSQPEPIANAQTSPPLRRDNPSQLITEESTPVGLSISEIFERFKETQLKTSKSKLKTVESTLRVYSGAIARFDEFIKGKPVTKITRSDISSYRDLLLLIPARPKHDVAAMPLVEQVKIAEAQGLPRLSANTARKDLMALSSVFTYCIEMGICESNPVQGTTKRLTQSISRVNGEFKQYSQDELVKIFTSPIYTEGFRPVTTLSYGEAVYWLPLLAYYTAARVEELAQLYVSDVKQYNGIHYLHITADKADKSVKNKGSVRKIPIHKHLIELGFVDYINKLPMDSRVFHELTVANDGRYANKVAAWLARYWRGKLGIRHEIKSMHGFRHTWKTLARDVGIPKEISDALTGHRSGDVAESYGQYSLELLKRHIDLIPELTFLGRKKQ